MGRRRRELCTLRLLEKGRDGKSVARDGESVQKPAGNFFVRGENGKLRYRTLNTTGSQMHWAYFGKKKGHSKEQSFRGLARRYHGHGGKCDFMGGSFYWAYIEQYTSSPSFLRFFSESATSNAASIRYKHAMNSILFYLFDSEVSAAQSHRERDKSSRSPLDGV